MNKTLTLLAVVIATAATSFAGTAVSSKKVVVAPQQDLFRAGELQIDAFAAGAAGNYGGGSVNGFGGGLGRAGRRRRGQQRHGVGRRGAQVRQRRLLGGAQRRDGEQQGE